MTEHVNVPDSSLKSNNKVATAPPIFEEFKVIELLDTEHILDSVDNFDAEGVPTDYNYEVETEQCSADIPDLHAEQKKKNTGPLLYLVRYPALVGIVATYLEANGFQAQARRRNEVGTALSMGVSLISLKKHVEECITDLVISKDTLHRLFHPPNKNHNSSALYKSLINARVSTKKNNAKKAHMDAHYDAAMVRACVDFAALFAELVGLLLCDDKAKVKVGSLAVSRYLLCTPCT